MYLNVRAIFFKAIGGAAVLVALFFVALPNIISVKFESLESKVNNYDPVYNQISLESDKKRDIWWMRQGHNGLNPPLASWDKLAIVIDKSVSPKTATFYQLDPTKKFIPINYRVKCFTCHPNGPRVIRPNYDSKNLTLSFFEKLQLLKWNIKIKSYGRVATKSYSANDPIKYTNKSANDPLKITLCVICHKESGLLARGTLVRQNFSSIEFLTTQGFMPPFKLPLTQKFKSEVTNFVMGL